MLRGKIGKIGRFPPLEVSINKGAQIHVSLLAIREADASSLSGLYTVLNLFASVVPDTLSFRAEIVAPDALVDDHGGAGNMVQTAPGFPIPVQRKLSEIPATDVLIIPSLFPEADGEWHTGSYPKVLEWIRSLYADEALICSSCTGALLLAETGLLDGLEATQHWAFEATFRRNFPRVRLNAAKVLVVTGDGARLVMSGASAAWHDLVLYIIARYAGPAAARTIAKFYLLHWHSDGQSPYIIFRENTRHGDAVILASQSWLREYSHEPNPIENVIRRSGLSERSFNRRFRKATGVTPIVYVQNLRVEAAKLELETQSVAIDDISAKVGYEDPAFFRRLFKRTTGLTPSAYRRKFCVIGVDV